MTLDCWLFYRKRAAVSLPQKDLLHRNGRQGLPVAGSAEHVDTFHFCWALLSLLAGMEQRRGVLPKEYEDPNKRTSESSQSASGS